MAALRRRVLKALDQVLRALAGLEKPEKPSSGVTNPVRMRANMTIMETTSTRIRSEASSR